MFAEDTSPVVKETSKGLKEKKRQTAIHARIKYRQRRIQTLKTHLQNGTFPPRMKSIKPTPKMDSPESQRIVNAACEQAQCVILDQMLVEEEKKLTQDQGLLEHKRKVYKKRVKKPSMAQVLKDLAELQEKYNELCKTTQDKPSPSDTPIQEAL